MPSAEVRDKVRLDAVDEPILAIKWLSVDRTISSTKWEKVVEKKEPQESE